MPTFPDTKNDIVILAAKVSAGISDNPADYPNPPFDPAPINALVGSALQLTGQRQAKDAYVTGSTTPSTHRPICLGPNNSCCLCRD